MSETVDRPYEKVPWEWPADQVAELVRLHEEGRGPTEIAGLMGLSKSAVCGKLKRMGLAVPRPRPRLVAGPRLQRRDILQPKNARKSIHPLPKRDIGPVVIWDLQPSTCRWPLFAGNEPVADQLYCGAEAIRGRPYCGEHCRRSMGGGREQQSWLGERR